MQADTGLNRGVNFGQRKVHIDTRFFSKSLTTNLTSISGYQNFIRRTLPKEVRLEGLEDLSQLDSTET